MTNEELRERYNPDGSLGESNEYNYTDSGAIDSISKYDAFIGQRTSLVFRYGANGTLNEITTYDSDKQVIKRTLIKYDVEIATSLATSMNEPYFLNTISTFLTSLSINKKGTFWDISTNSIVSVNLNV